MKLFNRIMPPFVWRAAATAHLDELAFERAPLS